VKLRQREVTVADILGYAEESEVPPSVTENVPGFTQAEWEACLRFVVHILLTYERNVLEQEEQSET
jgi:hypothetical protein